MYFMSNIRGVGVKNSCISVSNTGSKTQMGLFGRVLPGVFTNFGTPPPSITYRTQTDQTVPDHYQYPSITHITFSHPILYITQVNSVLVITYSPLSTLC
jgi:hypothetical protein